MIKSKTWSDKRIYAKLEYGKIMIGIIKGHGDLPKQLIKELIEKKIAFVVADLYYDNEAVSYPCMPAMIGEVGKIMSFLKKHNVTDLILVGGVERPKISMLKLDKVGRKWLSRLGLSFLKGDDALLRKVKELLNEEGFNLKTAGDYIQTYLHFHNELNIQILSNDDIKSITIGAEILDQLSPFDMGQAIIVEGERILGIEGPEGTEQLIKRCAPLKNTTYSGFLIKKHKLGQLDDIDAPTIGPKTIADLITHGFKGMAITPKSVQVIDMSACLKLIHENNFVIKFI
jgi:DUF1009 family protein